MFNNPLFREILHFDPQQRMETEGMPVDVRKLDFERSFNQR